MMGIGDRGSGIGDRNPPIPDPRSLIAFLACSLLLLVGCGARGGGQTAVSFKDIALQVGLEFEHGAFQWEMSGDPVAMMGSGLCWIDYDDDGWLDLYVVNSYAVAEAGQWDREVGSLPLSTLYHNDKGTFTDIGADAGVALPLRGTGCVAADLNNDGDTDLYITTSRANVLLWNNGDGTFTDGSADAGVGAYGWHTAVSVGDLNKDGWPDLFVAGYVDVNSPIPNATMGFPNTNFGVRDLLFINDGENEDGSVTFREVGELVGLESADFEYALGSSFTDLDSDGDLDLFVANDTNPNRLYENVPVTNDPLEIGFRFVELGESVAVGDTNSGMGVATGDMDGDGRFDLFITNMGHQLHSVYQNRSEARQLQFLDWANLTGIDAIGAGQTGWGTSWADFDLDSDLDLFVTNGAIPVVDLVADRELLQLYENLTAQGWAGQFNDWTVESNLADAGALIGRGSAAADFDNDGDLDVAVNQVAGPLLLLENRQQGGNWLTLDFVGEDAAGVVVTAVLPDNTTIVREMQIGSSYLASEDPRCHLGLGDHSRIKRLTITWPDGSETVRRNVRGGRILKIRP